MSKSLQELLVLCIVAGTAVSVGYKFYCSFVAPYLAQRLLAMGRVKWAMWVRRQATGQRSNCPKCK